MMFEQLYQVTVQYFTTEDNPLLCLDDYVDYRQQDPALACTFDIVHHVHG